MKRLAIVCAALMTCPTIVAAGNASAQQRSSGDKIVYAMQMGNNAQQTIKNTLTVTIDRVDKDGSGHAFLTLDAPHMPQFKAEATISPAGEILTKTDASIPDWSKAGNKAYSKEMYAQEMAVAGPGIVSMYLRSFNAFAAAAGARKKLKVGDTFKATSGGYPGDQLVYKVTGREQHLGRDAFVITMQSVPGAMQTISGQGYYDESAHLVVAFHADESMQQGTQILDISLTP